MSPPRDGTLERRARSKRHAHGRSGADARTSATGGDVETDDVGDMAALGISAAVPPSAAAQVNWSAVRNLARVAARVPRPQVIAGAVEAAGAVRYGVADVAVLSQLDDAGRALGAQVDATAAGVGAPSEAATFRKCVGEGLTAAGQSYDERCGRRVTRRRRSRPRATSL
jgi:hypothetical protein